MQDIELFVSLAEIAGVFVGFGALIAIRGGGTSDVYEVSGVGAMTWGGVMVVVVALAPVTISRFGPIGHELWLVCSLVALACVWIGSEAVDRMSPERRAFKAAWPLRVRAKVELAGAVLWVPMNVALVLVVLGLLPDQEPALYFAAAVLLLLQDAFLLLMMVTSVGRGVVASGPAAQSARGDSSA